MYDSSILLVLVGLGSCATTPCVARQTHTPQDLRLKPVECERPLFNPSTPPAVSARVKQPQLVVGGVSERNRTENTHDSSSSPRQQHNKKKCVRGSSERGRGTGVSLSLSMSGVFCFFLFPKMLYCSAVVYGVYRRKENRTRFFVSCPVL